MDCGGICGCIVWIEEAVCHQHVSIQVSIVPIESRVAMISPVAFIFSYCEARTWNNHMENVTWLDTSDFARYDFKWSKFIENKYCILLLRENVNVCSSYFYLTWPRLQKLNQQYSNLFYSAWPWIASSVILGFISSNGNIKEKDK